MREDSVGKGNRIWAFDETPRESLLKRVFDSATVALGAQARNSDDSALGPVSGLEE